MTIGERITALLDQQGWTQEDLARKMRVSRQSVNSMIAGRFRLTPLMALKLERVSQGSLPAEAMLRIQLRIDLEAAKKTLKAEKLWR